METSRLIVKNLPPYLKLERLRELFSEKGQVTDVKIMQTRSGKSRQFGFVGFKTADEAKEAVQFFNKSFIDTFRLNVDLALPQGDKELPRSWSRHTKIVETPPTPASDSMISDKKREDIEEKKRKHLAAIGIGSEDAKLNEFLQVMKPRSQMKTWENDDIAVDPAAVSQINNAPAHEIPTVRAALQDDDDVLYEDMPPKTNLGSSRNESQDVEENVVLDGHVDDHGHEKLDEKEDKPQELKEDPLRVLDETGRLFARNLAFSVSEEDLREMFSKYGMLSEVHIPIDVETKKSKGIAYISFMIPENAIRAYEELDGQVFQGRLLHLIPAREKRVVEIPENVGSAYKNKKAQKMKANSSNENTWNSLFMSADAVADAMAKKLEVGKGDILDPEADGMAVRLALAETHIIQDTIKYLEEQGVVVDAFKMNMKKERSDKIIMIKNLPFSVDERELNEMFKRHGDVLRLILPPTRTVALVEYTTGNEAKAAFKAFAYKNFHGKPLLLEMAPIGVLSGNKKKDNIDKHDLVDGILKEGSGEDTEAATLFIKNLSFTSSNDSLSQLFATAEGFRSAKISMKTNPKTGKMLSMGFGFVEFDSTDSAKKALKVFQNHILDDHALQIKFSDRGVSKSSTSGKSGKEVKAKGSKLLVRNVPFEATKKDIHDLFATYGQLKRVRLPKKFDNKSHRGFAFVDFLTKQEAKNAFESLANTHLYGRHLVIEWAENDDSIDAIREKAKREYQSVGDSSQKRSRVTLGEEGDEYEEEEYE